METVKIALTQYGVNEKENYEAHPQIVKYYESIGYDSHDLARQPSWSSAFLNWVTKKAGYECSGKLDARSWLRIGESTNLPCWGDIAILWEQSPESTEGHVGIFIKETRRYVYLLGGDQRNKVCIKAYPKNKVLDYRRLKRVA